jgi:hypothetical protein
LTGGRVCGIIVKLSKTADAAGRGESAGPEPGKLEKKTAERIKKL